MNKPVIGILDIETSPYEAYVWGLWDQNIGVEQIKTERTVISYAYKELGSSEVVYKDTGGRGAAKVRDDKVLLAGLAAILDRADIIIAQNGKKFDLRVINGRMAMHRMRPYSPPRIIDTLSAAKKYFAFGSNRLAWLSKHLTDTPKSEHKEFPGMQLWLECLKDNPAAWRVLKKYNIRDIIATEKVYLEFRPWLGNHPNMGVYLECAACVACGSSRLQARGQSVTQSAKYPRFQCQDCGKWNRGTGMQIEADVRKTLMRPL